MVAYLSKSDASEGFNQIIDFLNGSLIKYALTVNLNIYASYIKQFWTTVAVKKVNDIIRLQAPVDKKKVVVTEAMIREALRLDDAEGVECLPNEEIFAELARMGYEKPSTKLTFYKAFFSSQWNLVRNVDSPTKFYMYPPFLQLMIRNQVGDLSTHTTKYTSPTLTQNVFANIRRVGKGFSRVETPLFEGMIVEQHVAEGDTDEVHGKGVNAGVVAEGDVSAAHDEVPTVDEELSIPSPTPPTLPLQPSQDIPSTSQDDGIPMDLLQTLLDTWGMIAEMDQDVDVFLEETKDVADDAKDDQDESDETEPAEVQEVVDVVTTAKLIIEVVTAAIETITTAGILVKEPKLLKKQVQIKQNEQYARELEAELNRTIDWDEVIDHVNKKAKEDHAVKRYQALKRKPRTEAQAIKNMMIFLKNVAGFKMHYFKGMYYDDIRPIFEAKFYTNVAFLQKIKKKHAKCLMLLVKELVLLSQDDAVRLMLASQIDAAKLS
nr:xylulose kinase-1 [Tanacetum cinerariifolium]